MLNISRIKLMMCSGRRYASLYSTENVLSKENKKRTAAKFANIRPPRLNTHPSHRRAAVLIPLCVVDGKVSLLYTLRAAHMKTHRGQVSFPGGMMDPNDKSLEETAIRETKEELGINERNIHIWGKGQLIPGRGNVCVLPVIGEIKEFSFESLNINKNEVEKAFAVTLEELCNAKKLRYTQFRQGFSLPVFMTYPKRIWGLTALITNAFLKSLLPSIAYSHRIKNVPSVTISSINHFGKS